MTDRVLVAGATGGVGQLAVAQLLDQGWSVRVLARSPEKVRQLFADRVELSLGDIRQPETLPIAMQDITAVICATGTTAFPSPKWQFEQTRAPAALNWLQVYTSAAYRQTHARNSPQQVDAAGVQHLVAAAPRSLKRFVYISSCGVTRSDRFPYAVLNAFGVLTAKRQGEQSLQQSGLPYTIIRPGRLIDGPFTSSDLNTLLQATTQGKLNVVLGQGDRLNGQTSRIDVAAAAVECLRHDSTQNQSFELISQGPRPSAIDWTALFAQLQA